MTTKIDRQLDQASQRLIDEAAARARWRGRDARAEPFRPVDEIREAGQRAGWTVITADDEERAR